MVEADGLTTNILFVTFCVGLICLWIASRDLAFPKALLVVIFKITIPLMYFAWFADGTWTFVDDIEYFYQGQEMLQLGYTPLTALLSADGRWHMLVTAGGSHIIYMWWNLFAQYVFGSHYYSPVFLNIVLTFISGYIAVRIMKEVGLSEKYRSWFLVFFLLHWDIVAWSSFPNLKDILVMTLTTLSLWLVIRFPRKPTFLGVLAILITFSIFFWIRVYISGLMVLTVLIWVFASWQNRLKYVFLVVIFALTLSIPLAQYTPTILVAREVLYGLLRFPLTPRPWGIEASYSFLSIPAVLHWSFILPSIFAGIALWRNYTLARVPLIYLIIIWVFFAMIPMLQGPRHRVQATFVLAWMQFHFLWMLISKAMSRNTRPTMTSLQ